MTIPVETTTANEPWLVVLVQGFFEPAELCARLDQLITFNGTGIEHDGSPTPGFHWFVSIAKDRFAFTTVLDEPPADTGDAIGPAAKRMQDIAAEIMNVWAQSQSITSYRALRLGNYATTSVKVRGEYMKSFLDLEDIKLRSSNATRIAPISRTAFVRGVRIAEPAIWDQDFRRAIRDFSYAMSFQGEDRLIYLWRSAEEILRAHDSMVQPGRSPGYKPGAEELKLYYRSDLTKVSWMEEIGSLAHQYSRHSGKRDPTKLPSDFHNCVEAARLRISELIRRHARFIDGRVRNKRFHEPHRDILTDWTKSP